MKRFLPVFLCLLTLISFSGCGGYKGDMSFTYILPGAISTLDPQTASSSSESTVIDSIFEGLCRIDDEGNLSPGVAKSWKHNENYTEFTFKLRNNAKWSDGTPVTADDFVFGITRALSPDTAAPSMDDMFIIRNARRFYDSQAEASELGVRAEDEHTLVIELEKEYPDFPALTAGIHFMPCNRAYFEECAGHYGRSSQYILTNGPFTLNGSYAWRTDYGSRCVYLVRSNYYRGDRSVTPALLTYLIDYDSAIDDDPVGALLENSVDILTLPESAAREAEAQGCDIIALNNAVSGLLLNPTSSALSSVYVREMFIKTIDRQEILSRYGSEMEGTGEAAGIMPECVLWNGEPYYSEGETLFTEQDDGIVGGLSSLLYTMDWSVLPSITVMCPDDEESISIANGLLVSWNSKLGTSFNILPLSLNEYKSRLQSGNYEAALYTLKAEATTPFEIFKMFESGASPVLMDSEEFDETLRSSDFSFSSAKDLESMIQSNYVFYPIFRDNTYYALSPSVKNISVSPDMGVDFSQAVKR